MTQTEGQQDDCYVWPWMAIVVNIATESNNIDYWQHKFAKYNPQEVHILQNEIAVIKFVPDWNAFMKVTDFEKVFETENRGRKDWNLVKENPGPGTYGWCARADDFGLDGPVGEYLRKEGKLRTIADIVQENTQGRNSIVADLTSKIDETNESLTEMHYKYNEKTLSLSRVFVERDRLHAAFVEETKNLQKNARKNLQKVLDEHERLNHELEVKKKKLDEWSRELNKRETLTELEKQKLDEDKKKKDAMDKSLDLASLEQQKTDVNVSRLVEEQKHLTIAIHNTQREKEEALSKILKLEKELDAKQKLEMEIQELRGKLNVMKHLGDDMAVQEKVDEMKRELEDKMDDLKDMEDMNTGLMVKERSCNDEIQEARKELLEGMHELLGVRNKIGIKRMGEINEKAFANTCKQKFPAGEAQIQATTLCSLWQENLKNPQWHPFKFQEVNGKIEAFLSVIGIRGYAAWYSIVAGLTPLFCIYGLTLAEAFENMFKQYFVEVWYDFLHEATQVSNQKRNQIHVTSPQQCDQGRLPSRVRGEVIFPISNFAFPKVDIVGTKTVAA
ncbi:hypothetical protein ACFE04_031893 [Oxalis oulophora]